MRRLVWILPLLIVMFADVTLEGTQSAELVVTNGAIDLDVTNGLIKVNGY